MAEAQALASSTESLKQTTKDSVHQIYNFLNVIIGRSELALFQLDAGDPGREHVEKIRNVAEQIIPFVEQLRTASKP